MRGRYWLLCTTATITCLSIAGGVRAGPITLVDVIPNAASAETQQNSEPSIGVNPNDPNQLISGAFTALFSPPPTNVTTPYWISNNGGTTWSGFGSLQTLDKSIAFNGSTPLTATLNGVGGVNNQIQTFSSINGTSFNNNLNNFNPPARLDQPWIRTGPSNHVYVGYNNLSNFGGGNGKTATINVSTNGGMTYTPKVIETVTPTSGQDAPSIREAVNGNTVYAVFTRWNNQVSNTGGGLRFASQEIVVKSTDGGATFSAGTQVATPISPFTQTDNTSLSVGAERVGSDNAIAVDPNNANHVVVAYVDTPAIGQMQVHVAESTDGGLTWANKLTTPLATRSAQPALTITENGDTALVYNNYNPQTDKLSQHLVTTTDDFATTTETILATENNSTSGGPAIQFDPYVGDFFDLTSIGNILYGIFSASNADNGILGSFLAGTEFQRNFVGTPGAASFALRDLGNNPVAFSVDPFFFTVDLTAIPEPGTLILLGTSLLGLAALLRRRS